MMVRRLFALVLVTILATGSHVVTAGAAKPAPDRLTVSVSPDSIPAFDPGITDYVVRCNPGEAVHVAGTAPAGAKVKVAGGPARSGSFSQDLGLRAGQSFSVKAVGNGPAAAYYFRCLPPDFPEWSVTRPGTPQLQWVIYTPSLGQAGRPYTVVADNRGTPVWWMRDGEGTPVDAKLLPDGNLLWSHLDCCGTHEYRLDGTIARSWNTVGVAVDFHDLQVLANGDVLMLGQAIRHGIDLSPFADPSSDVV